MRKSNSIDGLTENQRLAKVMEVLGFKQNVFAGLLGMEPGSLSAVFNGKMVKGELKIVGISNMLKRLLEVQFNLNLVWLETGEGEMFNVISTAVTESSVDYVKKDESEFWKNKYLEVNEKYIALLEKTSSLSTANSDKRNTG